MTFNKVIALEFDELDFIILKDNLRLENNEPTSSVKEKYCNVKFDHNIKRLKNPEMKQRVDPVENFRYSFPELFKKGLLNYIAESKLTFGLYKKECETHGEEKINLPSISYTMQRRSIINFFLRKTNTTNYVDNEIFKGKILLYFKISCLKFIKYIWSYRNSPFNQRKVLPLHGYH